MGLEKTRELSPTSEYGLDSDESVAQGREMEI